MRIPLDRQDDTPLYQQIELYLRQSILSGSLQPYTRLPATRQMARDLDVNRITVQNAYANLEADGLIYSQVGSGTYVLPQPTLHPIPKSNPEEPWPLWQQEIEAERGPAHPNGGHILKEMVQTTRHPDLINFSGGSGDARLFPVKDYRRVIQTILRRDGIAALDYGEYSGFAPLRSTIAHVLASQGIEAHPENILITAGSQQAIALVSQLLLKSGDTVLVESPTYATALDLFRSLGLKIVTAPVDEKGMQVENLEKLLQQHHPRLIYTIPNFHNPTGACMTSARRRQLIALADRYNVPILEDDFVGDLRYDGRSQPALKSLDPGGRVIFVSTFSKMLMPGLRVGFLMAEGPVYERLVDYKRVIDLTTSNLQQRVLEAYMTVGRYQAHLRRSSLLYRKRRDAMLQAINRYLPADVHVDPPQGGLFIWLRLPEGLTAEILLPFAVEEGVVFALGTNFFLEKQDGDRFMRLNFVSQTPEENEEGIRRLGKAIHRLAASEASKRNHTSPVSA